MIVKSIQTFVWSSSMLNSNVLSLSRMHKTHSLYKYTWTVRGGHLFNNAYYKNIVRKTDWFIESQVNFSGLEIFMFLQ